MRVGVSFGRGPVRGPARMRDANGALSLELLAPGEVDFFAQFSDFADGPRHQKFATFLERHPRRVVTAVFKTA